MNTTVKPVRGFPLSDLADLFLWGPPVGIPGITRVVLNRFGRIPFLGFDRVGDWPNVWTTEIRTDRNGFGFDLVGLGQIKPNLKQLALPGLRFLMWFRLLCHITGV